MHQLTFCVTILVPPKTLQLLPPWLLSVRSMGSPSLSQAAKTTCSKEGTCRRLEMCQARNGKKRERERNGRNAFFPFPFLHFWAPVFGQNHEKWVKKEAERPKKRLERCGTEKNGRSSPFQILEFGEIPFFIPFKTRFCPRSNPFFTPFQCRFCPFLFPFLSHSCTTLLSYLDARQLQPNHWTTSDHHWSTVEMCPAATAATALST